MFEHAGEFCLVLQALLLGAAIAPKRLCHIIMERDFVDSKLESCDI